MTVKHLRNLQRVQMSGKFKDIRNIVKLLGGHQSNHKCTNPSLIFVVSLCLLQLRSHQMPPSWANTEQDSTSAWTRSHASCPPRRGLTQRWGRGSSTTCPAAWARWCPWTTRSRPRPSSRTWLSPSTCSSLPLFPSAAQAWAPNSALSKLSLLKSSVGSNLCQQPMDSSLFWSLTQPLRPPQLPLSPFMQTQECLLRLTPVRRTAAQHRPQHLQSTAWRPSPGGPRRSARLGSAPARKAASWCGGLGSDSAKRLKPDCITFKFRLLTDCCCGSWACDFSAIRDGNTNHLLPTVVLIVSFYGAGALDGTWFYNLLPDSKIWMLVISVL